MKIPKVKVPSVSLKIARPKAIKAPKIGLKKVRLSKSIPVSKGFSRY